MRDNLLTFSGERETELRERFVKYETELSAANRKIADRTCFSEYSNEIVTLLTQSEKNATPNDLQTRVEQLVQEMSKLEEDKRKLSKEKDDLSQQLIQQKDRMLETERDSRYIP
jgi:predicted nuclease with TOPRIM domain